MLHLFPPLYAWFGSKTPPPNQPPVSNHTHPCLQRAAANVTACRNAPPHTHTHTQSHTHTHTLTQSHTHMFSRRAAASALAALQSKRDSLQKRTETLMRLKNEFQELSKVL